MWGALDRVCAMARLDGVTPFMLRRTFASVAGDLSSSQLTIVAMVGHAAPGVKHIVSISTIRKG
jgi:hypothetical protein